MSFIVMSVEDVDYPKLSKLIKRDLWNSSSLPPPERKLSRQGDINSKG
ncbi:MAG: hypothetical protein WBA16_10010 [Nonlabens sp.]